MSGSATLQDPPGGVASAARGRSNERTLISAIAVGLISGVAAVCRAPAPAGVLTRLPGDGNQLALTVDDGASVPVVAAFAQFCRDTGTQLT
jgi:peptidoglycan-N-acetylglucosamine deacetylase